MGWERSRNTIGQNRTWILGRALAGLYFVTIGLVLLGIGIMLAIVFAVIEGAYTFIFNRPLNFGRSWMQMLAAHQIKLGQYTLGMRSFPGIIPRRESGRR